MGWMVRIEPPTPRRKQEIPSVSPLVPVESIVTNSYRTPFATPFAAFASSIDRRVLVPAACLGVLSAGPAAAHEAWLLSPSQVEVLSRTPLPHLFTDGWSLGLAAAVGALVALAALQAERRLRPLEAGATAALARIAPELGPVAVRLGLAAMLALSALGLLPRHGTPLWAEPTLFVPDMQLSLAPAWTWLALVQIALAVVLAIGLFTRAAGLMVIALSFAGLAAFGAAFLSYAPHFIAPGLMLALFGGGRASLDRATLTDGWLQPDRATVELGWKLALALLGGGFVYLAVSYKLTQPTLLIAILEYGEVPTLGLPLDVVALVMTGVELIAGTLLALGRLTRPIALFFIAAFTFFAVAIGETPFFHANLYGVMAMLALSGATAPDTAARTSGFSPRGARA
jgi:uncharacterized membrane protein YphA (DoxX/SURF4 family)